MERSIFKNLFIGMVSSFTLIACNPSSESKPKTEEEIAADEKYNIQNLKIEDSSKYLGPNPYTIIKNDLSEAEVSAILKDDVCGDDKSKLNPLFKTGQNFIISQISNSIMSDQNIIRKTPTQYSLTIDDYTPSKVKTSTIYLNLTENYFKGTPHSTTTETISSFTHDGFPIVSKDYFDNYTESVKAKNEINQSKPYWGCSYRPIQGSSSRIDSQYIKETYTAISYKQQNLIIPAVLRHVESKVETVCKKYLMSKTANGSYESKILEEINLGISVDIIDEILTNKIISPISYNDEILLNICSKQNISFKLYYSNNIILENNRNIFSYSRKLDKGPIR